MQTFSKRMISSNFQKPIERNRGASLRAPDERDAVNAKAFDAQTFITPCP
jgi:hypothetical protein